MPLVVPGLMNKDGDDKTSKWMNELVGKKIGDESNETVRALYSCPSVIAGLPRGCSFGLHADFVVVVRLSRAPSSQSSTASSKREI